MMLRTLQSYQCLSRGQRRPPYAPLHLFQALSLQVIPGQPRTPLLVQPLVGECRRDAHAVAILPFQ